MKNTIRLTLLAVIYVIVFAIVTVIDVLTVATLVLNKGFRWLSSGAIAVLIDRRNADNVEDELISGSNITINYSYKSIVDLLYPTEFEEEE